MVDVSITKTQEDQIFGQYLMEMNTGQINQTTRRGFTCAKSGIITIMGETETSCTNLQMCTACTDSQAEKWTNICTQKKNWTKLQQHSGLWNMQDNSLAFELTLCHSCSNIVQQSCQCKSYTHVSKLFCLEKGEQNLQLLMWRNYRILL